MVRFKTQKVIYNFFFRNFVKQEENLVVTKTFSKFQIYGKFRAPYNFSYADIIWLFFGFSPSIR